MSSAKLWSSSPILRSFISCMSRGQSSRFFFNQSISKQMNSFGKMSQESLDFVQLTNENASEISQFLIDHFLIEEPLNRASGMSCKNFRPFVDKLLERTLNIPFSFALVQPESKKIVACVMSSLWTNEKNNGLETTNSENHSDEFTFETGQKKGVEVIGKILTGLHAKFYEINPEINKVLHLEILSVAKEYQRRGLASKLMNKTEDVERMKEFECAGIASELSSLANQCLMKKRGYTVLAETLLSSECDDSGNPLIVPDDGTDRVVLAYKKF